MRKRHPYKLPSRKQHPEYFINRVWRLRYGYKRWFFAGTGLWERTGPGGGMILAADADLAAEAEQLRPMMARLLFQHRIDRRWRILYSFKTPRALLNMGNGFPMNGPDCIKVSVHHPLWRMLGREY